MYNKISSTVMMNMSTDHY